MRNCRVWATITCLLVTVTTAAYEQPLEGADPAQLVERALELSPGYTQPLLADTGAPVVLLGDLDRDGRTDVMSLTTLRERGVPRSITELRRTSRLFREDVARPFFHLEIYLAGEDAVRTVSLGRWPAIGDVSLLPLGESEGPPFAVIAEMRSAAGDEANVFTVSSGGQVQRLQLREDPQERFHIADITGNGMLDVVIARRLPEAGRGFETFLELLEFGEEGFAPTASFPLVRDLRAFLDTSAAHILAGDWRMLGETVSPLPGAATDEETLLARTFTGVANDDEDTGPVFDHHTTGSPVRDVMMPVILENPFPFPYAGTSFTLVFRVEPEEGPARLYSAVVALDANPFVQNRFHFLTLDNPGQ
jgi:hypothetical protein